MIRNVYTCLAKPNDVDLRETGQTKKCRAIPHRTLAAKPNLHMIYLFRNDSAAYALNSIYGIEIIRRLINKILHLFSIIICHVLDDVNRSGCADLRPTRLVCESIS